MTRFVVRDLVSKGVLLVEDGNHGEYRPRPDEFVSEGIPFIRAADMSRGLVDFERAGRISEVARARVRKGIGAPGDVILSHKGTVGRVAVAPADSPDFVCSPQTTFWRSRDSEVLDQRYLRYLMSSADFVRQLDVLKGQTDMAPYVSLSDQRSMEIVLLPIARQRAIAEVLGALDDKIAANERICELADDLARAKWRKARTGGRQVALSELASFINGKAFTKGASGNGRVVIRIAELNSGVSGSTVYSDIDVADDHLAQPGDLLFAWSGSLTVARWFRPAGIVNQHIFKVIPKHGCQMWMVNQALLAKLDDFKAIASDKATTMGHIQRRHLDETTELPDIEVIRCIDAAMSVLWDRALAAERENLKLAKTRDELLPLLMSGKLRVKDVETIAAEML
ncbi:type I restriction-modification system specificity subunit [Mycobacteroides abscessus subsp. bolletii]|uniref:restriction endonuclease subunit S n=1 Tax=Mycobacteroides abscessus TaxID=36809 RepID=UPI0009A62298|nr:restriction endonuclease subunit S [Mycobacteroides abscessus]SLF17922.1 type I restriction-modification system specificity subunit [Mycobacteroides abscessus subsp. bolletii]